MKFLLSPVHVLPSLVIAIGVWVWRGKPDGVLRFIFPKELYLHPSTLVDIKLALFNLLVFATGLFDALFFAPFVTIAALDMMTNLAGGQMTDETGLWRGVLAAALLFPTQDFCRFWNHYLHHETRVLWPFHAVHPSAEVMTPITVLRAHPAYSSLQAFLISALVGLMQAIVLIVLGGRIEPWVVYAVAGAFNTYVFFNGHLRHSHI